jgi:outer membrane lipoprotein-sorting protein
MSKEKKQKTLMRLAAAVHDGAKPFLLACLLAGCAEMPAKPNISDADAPEIAHIQDALNAMPRLEAHFVQSGDFGPGAGTLWLDRPGHLRIDYQGASSRVMVANGGHLIVYDRATHSTTTVSLSRTPLGMLLTPHIALSGPVTVTGLQRGDGFEQISLAKTATPDQGALRLVFRTQPFALDSVTVVDAYHRSLTMTLSNLRLDPSITPQLFGAPGSANS